jgi:hypothetical protein
MGKVKDAPDPAYDERDEILIDKARTRKTNRLEGLIVALIVGHFLG